MKPTKDTPWIYLALALIAVFGYHVFVTDARDLLVDEPLWYLYIALIALGGGGAFIIIGKAAEDSRSPKPGGNPKPNGVFVGLMLPSFLGL